MKSDNKVCTNTIGQERGVNNSTRHENKYSTTKKDGQKNPASRLMPKGGIILIKKRKPRSFLAQSGTLFLAWSIRLATKTTITTTGANT